jgi:hypothetical protein
MKLLEECDGDEKEVEKILTEKKKKSQEFKLNGL